MANHISIQPERKDTEEDCYEVIKSDDYDKKKVVIFQGQLKQCWTIAIGFIKIGYLGDIRQTDDGLPVMFPQECIIDKDAIPQFLKFCYRRFYGGGQIKLDSPHLVGLPILLSVSTMRSFNTPETFYRTLDGKLGWYDEDEKILFLNETRLQFEELVEEMKHFEFDSVVRASRPAQES